VTGINFFSGELAAKRLELLRDLVPGATRVAVLVNPSDAPNTEITLQDVEAAASSIGLQIQVFRASTSSEINAAFATIVRERSLVDIPTLRAIIAADIVTRQLVNSNGTWKCDYQPLIASDKTIRALLTEKDRRNGALAPRLPRVYRSSINEVRRPQKMHGSSSAA